MSFLNTDHGEGKSGTGKVILIAIVALVGLGVGYYWLTGRVEEPMHEPEEAAAPPSVETTEEVETPAPRDTAPELPATGALVIRANVDGASVYVDGELVGPAPFNDTAFSIGQYEIKVTKDGYRDFVDSIRVRPGREAKLTASLELLPPSLRIVSDIPGATVFLDRDYKGTTPVEIKDVTPGEHQLTVSAEGYDMYAETVTVTTGHRDLTVNFQQAAAVLHESIAVIHKHSFGKCEGTLVADPNGIRYETDHKDAFAIPYASLERFEVDYVEKNMNLKVQKGKNYNFTEQRGNADALFVFHKNVKEFLDKM